MLERNSFVLKRVRNYGDDYGGSHCSEDTETTYDEIDAESIIVKNGHFAGVAIISEYDYYNGGSDNKLKDSVPKADKNHGQTEKTRETWRGLLFVTFWVLSCGFIIFTT